MFKIQIHFSKWFSLRKLKQIHSSQVSDEDDDHNSNNGYDNDDDDNNGVHAAAAAGVVVVVVVDDDDDENDDDADDDDFITSNPLNIYSTYFIYVLFSTFFLSASDYCLWTCIVWDVKFKEDIKLLKYL